MQVSKPIKNTKGATAVFVAIGLAALVGMAALAVDVGYLYATRSELQNVSDAAALAGANFLGATYAGLSYQQQQNHVFTRSAIVSAVQQVGLKNRASQRNIVINDGDVVIGLWIADENRVEPTLTSPDAVQVTARLDGQANSPASTFFARIWGANPVDVRTNATAALTGPAIVDEGELKTPFSLSELNFPNDCSDEIAFHPTTASCAGWHNFFDDISASEMEKKLLGFIAGDGQDPENNPCLLQPCGQDWLDANFDMNKEPDPAVTPQTPIGEDFEHQGGTIGSLFTGGLILDPTMDTGSPIQSPSNKPAPMPALYHYFKRRDGDGDDSKWTATIPVYYEDGETCGNPNGPMLIVGFARIEVFMPNPPPDKTISVKVDCNQSIIDGRGGGGNYGNLKGSIPNLVE